MNKKQRAKAEYLYLLLAGLFITALVVCNLVANKFIEVDLGFLGFETPFIISAGVLPYPVTFLITDLLSEFYGRRRTNNVVLVGFGALIFTLGIIWLGKQFPAVDFSPLSDDMYNSVFANTPRVIGASMTAYIVAQLIDVQIFHFWKRLTKGKYLWLRNNASTIFSQLVDTTLVVLVLFLGERSWGEMGSMIGDGWLFKAMCALFDTLLIYGLAFWIRKVFRLRPGEELRI